MAASSSVQLPTVPSSNEMKIWDLRDLRDLKVHLRIAHRKKNNIKMSHIFSLFNFVHSRAER